MNEERNEATKERSTKNKIKVLEKKGYAAGKDYKAIFDKNAVVNVRDEIIIGKHDKMIKQTADNLRIFGKKNGGFFITTMNEPNLKVQLWAGNPEE